MTTLDQIAGKIIKEQELIIGPLAWDEASHVKGLNVVDKKTGNVALEPGVGTQNVINDLVHKYEVLFGKAALEVCKAAAASLIADLQPSEVPSSLK